MSGLVKVNNYYDATSIEHANFNSLVITAQVCHSYYWPDVWTKQINKIFG